MKVPSQWKIALLCAAALAAALIWFYRPHSATKTLNDGTRLTLEGLKVGQTNSYKHGSFASKMLGNLIPTNGIKLAGWQLQRPETIVVTSSDGCEALSAQLRLQRSTNTSPLESPPFYRKYRLLICGDNGLTFVQDLPPFRRHPDGIFSYLRTEVFPRDSKQLRFRIEGRDRPQGRDWTEVATFTLPNPKRPHIEKWQPQGRPRIKLADDLEVEIGNLTVLAQPIHPDDIWEHMALLPVRVFDHGQLSTNWGVHSGPIWDTSGNRDYFTFRKNVTNDWMIYQIFRPLDPAKPWRFQIHIALDTNLPPTDLVSFSVPWPLSSAFQTNLGGSKLQVDFVNRDMLAVELVDKPPDLRLTFVSATDDAGTHLANYSGSWGQHSFWKSLDLHGPTLVHATVAIHRDYKAEFTLKPENIRGQ